MNPDHKDHRKKVGKKRATQGRRRKYEAPVLIPMGQPARG